MKKDFPHLPAVKIHLHKSIPIGAGLGGGSSDAAYTLMALNDRYALNLLEEQLLSYALMLGSDCPFFIINKPCIAGGRGEILEPVNISLAGYRLVILNPGIHLSTPWAFSHIKVSTDLPVTHTNSFHYMLSSPLNTWKGTFKNDFEEPVFKKYPAIRAARDLLYARGALFAMMSGSGSSVYGIFDKETQHSIDFPENLPGYSIIL
ncbi:MAG: 4-(cytidine 5'-diphospho)-2-C-methyl-D-erythritol kinase [Ferruginibacter sp.]